MQELFDNEQPQQPELFEAQRPIVIDLDDPEAMVLGRVIVTPNAPEMPGEEVEEA